MDLVETNAMEVVARNIAQLEAAHKLATGKMEEELFQATAEILDEQRADLGFEGENGESFATSTPWFAAPEWRVAGEELGGNYHLYGRLSFDGTQQQTTLAYFAGLEESCVYLDLYSDSLLTKTARQKLTAAIGAELAEMLDAGFEVHGNAFDIRLPLRFDRDAFSRGYRDGTLVDALQPLATGMAKLAAHRPLLDRIHAAIAAQVGM